MAIEAHQEVSQAVRDSRTVDRKITDFLSQTHITMMGLAVFGVWVVVSPWVIHLAIPVALVWWASVTGTTDRRVLPYFLPISAGIKDKNNPLPGTRVAYAKPEGIIFLGNAVDRYLEIWETSSAARQHRILFGTTGAGKSEALSGIFANHLILGGGVVFADAKGTPEQVSRLWWMSRVFGREVDYFNMYYGTGGKTVRSGRRDRLCNKNNPVAYSSDDQILNLLLSFLPKESGENQIFAQKAQLLAQCVTPALTYLRDIHNHPLSINTIKNYLLNFQALLDLAYDEKQLLDGRSRGRLIDYLNGLQPFEFAAYEKSRKAGQPYEINSETARMFGIASGYFSQPLSSFQDTYGHIYHTPTGTGELDWKDAILNRRIVVVSLPSLEKAGAELTNIANINLSSIRAAIAVALGDGIEGHRSERLDNLPSTSEVPSGIILDEYGYMATEGFAIMMAQARSLGFSITIAGQDFSNLKQAGEAESEAMMGNAVLICLSIRNLKELGERVQNVVGEADVAVESSLDRKSGMVSGYMSGLTASVQRRHRVSGTDLVKLGTGEAYAFLGRNFAPVRFKPWAPLPEKAEEYVVNRFLPVSFLDAAESPNLEVPKMMDRLLIGRIEGTAPAPAKLSALPAPIAALVSAYRSTDASTPTAERWAAAVTEIATKPKAGGAVSTGRAPTPVRAGFAVNSAQAPTRQPAIPEPAATAPPPPPAPTTPHVASPSATDAPAPAPGGSAPNAGMREMLSRFRERVSGTEAAPSTVQGDDRLGPPPGVFPVVPQAEVDEADPDPAGAAQPAAAPASAALQPPTSTPHNRDMRPAAPQPKPPSQPAVDPSLMKPGVASFGLPSDDDDEEGPDAWVHPDLMGKPATRIAGLDASEMHTIPMDSRLDEDHEEQDVGQLDDADTVQSMDMVGRAATASITALEGVPFSPRTAANGAAQTRDLAASLHEMTRYRPPPVAPKQPYTLEHLRNSLARVRDEAHARRTNRAKGRDNGEQEGDGGSR